MNFLIILTDAILQVEHDLEIVIKMSMPHNSQLILTLDLQVT